MSQKFGSRTITFIQFWKKKPENFPSASIKLKTKLSQQSNSHKIEMSVKVKRIDVKRLGFTFDSH